ncbi:SGNH/GDSL hydrolase family protein [Lutimaribacter marinistellae]|uniref:SGNH/GDSL hydrolase family protein n=1 Tax=Lutimaribacter marinistellae TaxID=1820329 RepID=A0ABV7TDS9_9RHOB
MPLLPVLAAQGLAVRSRARLLPEPEGARSGRAGRGPNLRLLILGDSSAAGVGAGTQAQALSGQLVARLGRHYAVQWRLEAATGRTTADALAALERVDGPIDMAVTALGVNDVTRGVSRTRFADRQAVLLDRLATMGARRIVVSGVPPMERFPALPQPLAWVLGRQAARLDGALAALASARPHVEHLHFDMPEDPALAASDGYHPSPRAYALWAEQISGALIDRSRRAS